MKDELGDRMKGQYEDRTRYSLPRRTYTIIRLDGKAFHTYTKGLNKPFDSGLSKDIDDSIVAMLSEIQGAQFAYTQSDEISILLTDFATPQTSAWFDGNLQKMASVAASIITAEFNKHRWRRRLYSYAHITDAGAWGFDSMAFFDARVFTIPDRTEVMNYFIWRNNDCSRNSISMVAQHEFSHKELQGVSTTGLLEKLNAKGVSWESYHEGDKYGRLIVKENYTIPYPPEFKHAGIPGEDLNRSRWSAKPAWKFTGDMGKLLEMVPKYE